MRQFLLAILVVLTPSLVFASSESQTFDEVDSLTNQRSVGVLITSNESEDVRVRFRLNTETGEAFATLINTGVLHVYFSDNVLSQTKNVMYRSSVMGKPKKNLWHTGHTMLTLSDVCDETEFEPYGLHNIVEMMLGKMLTVAIPVVRFIFSKIYPHPVVHFNFFVSLTTVFPCPYSFCSHEVFSQVYKHSISLREFLPSLPESFIPACQ
jgi:hypothetical protein